jgi:hypothetical protein
MSHYKEIDWKKDVDFLRIQIQRFTCDTQNHVYWTEEISSHVKAVSQSKYRGFCSTRNEKD